MQSATDKLRILIVEDSERDAELLLAELERCGLAVEHERVWSADGLEVALDSDRWDGVVSDHAMPGFSGLDALSIVRSRERYLPFIIVSGAISEHTAVEAMRLGANDYILKSSLLRLGPALEREIADRRSREAMEALKSASLAQAVFIRSMSHDFKTPLTAIIGFSDVLLSGRLGPLTDEQEKSVRSIHGAGLHLSALAKSILDLSLIETGAGRLSFVPIDLEALLNDCVEMVRMPASEKGVVLSVDLPELVPALASDPIRLRQILENLVGNAVKFTDAGSVRISVGSPNSAIWPSK